MTKLAEYGYTNGVLEFFLGKNEDQILENVTSKGNFFYKIQKGEVDINSKNYEHIWFGRPNFIMLLFRYFLCCLIVQVVKFIILHQILKIFHTYNMILFLTVRTLDEVITSLAFYNEDNVLQEFDMASIGKNVKIIFHWEIGFWKMAGTITPHHY